MTAQGNFLATGKTGTIGRHLSQNIKSLDIDLLRIREFKGNLNNQTIIHLAGSVGIQKVQRDPILSHAVNVDGTFELAERALSDGCLKFIFVSTCHVYAPKDGLLNEDDNLDPINEYALQKFYAEQGLLKIYSQRPNQLLILRVFSVLDLYTKRESLGGQVRALLEGHEQTIIRNSSDLRDFMTPKQVATAIEELATKHSISETILNICTSKKTTVQQAVKKLVGSELFESLKDRIIPGHSQNPVIVGDSSLLKKYVPIDSVF
jgi:nucleoside-diphosphate-sugar epimerase